MTRLIDIEDALRDLAAAFDNEDWDEMQASSFQATEPADPIDPAHARRLLAQIETLRATFADRAEAVGVELSEHGRQRRAARAYLTSPSGPSSD